jgi:hypothetical protein
VKIPALFSFFLVAVLVYGCSPEDGLCDEIKYFGDNGFVCSQMDDYFSGTGAGISEEYTTKKAVYSATYVLNKEDVPGSTDVLINKPEYIPDELEFEKMTSCKIAPRIGGIQCSRWYSFTFLTATGEYVTFSSRNGDDLADSLVLKYVFLESDELSLEGSASSSEISFYDETVIDGTIYKTKHIYLIIER